MADFPATDLAVPATPSLGVLDSLLAIELEGGGGGGGPTTYFKMRAEDSGAGYVTWLATTPDYAGVGYPSGTPTPVGAMVPGSAVVAGRIVG